ncbi:glycosyltransferase family 4 protein [Rossellomorea marisflavi]|uniref:glycosyltransferase family 4 protein n=1 Tax=Rossellomorea marisflavi TaxID=189381 RepID=UPI000A9B9F04|nr:glycosyltransferase family 4 protein [Rossellomorea marisflavi]
MNKILFVATVDQHILHFHVPFLKWFNENGFEVHVASHGDNEIPYVSKKYNIPFSRNPIKLKNYTAYKELRKLIKTNNYRLIHCHTPTGGVLTRLASKQSRKKGSKVLYTAHGFHFFKGAPLKNWLIYYPIEKWLSKYTDSIITINEEDYRRITRGKFKSQKIDLVHGVGVDLSLFKPQTEEVKRELRSKYGFNSNQFLLLYVAELSHRKNHEILIRAVSDLKDKIPNMKLLLAGKGNCEYELKKLTEQLEVDEYIEFLGYRNDINNLMLLSDVAVSSSKQEGLPVNIMEAMASGLPLVVSNCRGNRDLVINNKNGYLVKDNNTEGFVKAINEIFNSKELRNEFGFRNRTLIQQYSLDKILESMIHLYKENL